MRFDEHGLGHDLAGEDLLGRLVDQFVASSKAALDGRRSLSRPVHCLSTHLAEKLALEILRTRSRIGDNVWNVEFHLVRIDAHHGDVLLGNFSGDRV